MTIKVTLNDKKVKGLFKALQDNSRDLRPALIRIGGMLEDASETAFELEGPGWKKLKPATLKARKRKGKTGKKLQVSGALASSVSSQIRGNSVFIGSNLSYAPVHQNGSTKKNIPKRTYLIIGKKQVAKSIVILEKHLLRGV